MKYEKASQSQKAQQGFTLTELVIAVALFTLIFFSIWGTMTLGFATIRESQARVEGATIANEQIELIRNLSFDDVGTFGGIPSGTLTADQVITRNNIEYTVLTDVIYVDDPFDGVAPTDTVSADYKRVRVQVEWVGHTGATSTPVISVTDVVPDGIEGSGSGGTLRVTVFDALGQAVQGANVHIVNNDVVPAIDTTVQTNATGQVILPGSPVCSSCYEITISKTGYSSERTYSDEEVFEPSKPHATIIEGDVTDISFSIDQTASLTTTAYIFNTTTTLPNVQFAIAGSKTIGNDSGGSPVLKFSATTTTDAQGQFQFSALEWDSYTVNIDGATEGYDIANEIRPQPYSISPAELATTSLFMATHTTHSFLATVADSSSLPIAGASVRLRNATTSYDTTLATQTGSGQAFFSQLSAIDYTVDITAPGFDPFVGSVSVNGATRELFNLNSL